MIPRSAKTDDLPEEDDFVERPDDMLALWRNSSIVCSCWDTVRSSWMTRACKFALPPCVLAHQANAPASTTPPNNLTAKCISILLKWLSQLFHFVIIDEQNETKRWDFAGQISRQKNPIRILNKKYCSINLLSSYSFFIFFVSFCSKRIKKETGRVSIPGYC